MKVRNLRSSKHSLCRITEKMDNMWPDLASCFQTLDVDKHVSPPYVSARPDVTMRSLKSTDKPQGNLKFIIIASDGCKYLFVPNPKSVANHPSQCGTSCLPRKR